MELQIYLKTKKIFEYGWVQPVLGCLGQLGETGSK